jgi:hypothetical protein
MGGGAIDGQAEVPVLNSFDYFEVIEEMWNDPGVVPSAVTGAGTNVLETTIHTCSGWCA